MGTPPELIRVGESTECANLSRAAAHVLDLVRVRRGGARASYPRAGIRSELLVRSLRDSEAPAPISRSQMSRDGFACPNVKCMCKECTCGEGCTCNVPDAPEPVSD